MLIGLGTGSFDATVKFWDTKSNSTKPLLTLSEAKDSVSSLAVVGHHVFVGSVDGHVRTYDIRMGEVHIDLIGSPVTSVTPTNQADSMLVSTLDSTLRLIDRRDGRCLKTYKGDGFVNETYRVRSTLGAGDAFILSGSEHGEIFIWDLLEGNVRHRLRHDPASEHKPTIGKKDVISAVTYCPTRMEWASAGGDGTSPSVILQQGMLTRQQPRLLSGPQTNISSFRYSTSNRPQMSMQV
jgi:mitogen-activated protein kinase organizer 1